MIVLTPNILAKGVAETWKQAYFSNFGGWYGFNCLNKELIYTQLVSIGDNPDPKDVNKIIGNESWTKTQCYNCLDINIPVVPFSRNDSILHICKKCLLEAVDTIDNMEV